MNRSIKNTISRFVAVIYLLFLLVYFAFNHPNTYIYFFILITAPIIDFLVFMILPSKKSEKHSNFKKTSKIQDKSLTPEELVLTKPLEKLTDEEFERLCFLYLKAKKLDVEDTSGNDSLQIHTVDKSKIAKWQREEALKRQLKYFVK